MADAYTRMVGLPGHGLPSSQTGGAESTPDGNTSKKGKRFKQGEVIISEEMKIAIDNVFARFLNADPSQYAEMEFPASLSNVERAYIHKYAQEHGLLSKSSGSKNNRKLSVKRKTQTVTDSLISMDITSSTQQTISNLIHRFPLTDKERFSLLPRSSNMSNNLLQSSDGLARLMTGKINSGIPQIPVARSDSSVDILHLPVLDMREQITQAIYENQVLLISGDTGSGKTTQIPQMVLDSYCRQSLPCRIFCAQPRRISAVSVSERVARERGENIGQSVGYQIRLESRVSPKTLLTYCTTGVLLRTLVAGENCLSAVTHIFVDELHERDKLTDFLLISLRQALHKYRNLKIILMSATLNTQLFSTYFNSCPIINVPGKLFGVTEYYLEDILNFTGYTNKKIEERKVKIIKVAEKEGWMTENDQNSVDKITAKTDQLSITEGSDSEDEITPELIDKMDSLIHQVWMTGNEEFTEEIFELILNDGVSANYQHSETGVTPLMAVCARGLTSSAEQLMNFGATIHRKAVEVGFSALSVATAFGQQGCVDILNAYSVAEDGEGNKDTAEEETRSLSTEDRILLEAYHASIDDERVDHSLIVSLVNKLLVESDDGSILVFLPGFDDIISLYDLIDASVPPHAKIALYILHSNMQTSDQKRVFKKAPPGIRKIILATNIAETSITINDVVYVIDCGKVKEKSYDALSEVSLFRSNWISQASAKQRAGRAGRCQVGVCYHLMSHARYKTLAPYQVAEILRSPLQELCLQTKLLAPVGLSISQYLSQAPEAPTPIMLKQAIQLLKHMDGLDENENLTELGSLLVDLPIEPRLGKMIMYAVLLKCLDPVLTIACTLAYKNPFQLPSSAHLKRESVKIREKFAADTYSDHMSYLRVFQAWQRSRSEDFERSFCTRNFVSSASMDMILGVRAQIMGQLRAAGFVKARGAGDVRDLNTNSENWAVIKACLCAGVYPNVLRVDRNKSTIVSAREPKVKIHPKSVLSKSGQILNHAETQAVVSKLPSDWIIYDEMSRSGRLPFVQCATVITPITVALFAGNVKLPVEKIHNIESYRDGQDEQSTDPQQLSSDSEHDDEEPQTNKLSFNIDGWINIHMEPSCAQMVLQLRQKWNAVLLRRIISPHKLPSQSDEAVCKAVVKVLTTEEQRFGLKQPSGIGQRPRPMAPGFSRDRRSTSQWSEDSSSSSDRMSKHKQSKSGHAKRSTKYTNLKENELGGQSSSSTPSSPHTSSVSNSPSHSPALTSNLTRTLPGGEPTVSCNYLLLKCTDMSNISNSILKGIWCTGQLGSKVITAALQTGIPCLLFITVHGSGMLQGVGKLMNEAPRNKISEFGNQPFTACYYIQWLKRGNIPYQTLPMYIRFGTGDWINEFHQPIECIRLDAKLGGLLFQLWDHMNVN